MTHQEKNITVSLISFVLILGFYLIRIVQMVQNETFTATNVFWLWGITIVAAIFMTIVITILAHIGVSVVHAVKTKEEPVFDQTVDERDTLIDLKGTRVTYFFSSIGSLIAMLTFVFGQPPLVMFTLLVISGLVAQIVGDSARLYFYRQGF